MPRQRGRRDECPPAARTGAAERRRLLVHARVGVLSRIVRIAEGALAFFTDAVHLLVVLFKVLRRNELLWWMCQWDFRGRLGCEGSLLYGTAHMHGAPSRDGPTICRHCQSLSCILRNKCGRHSLCSVIRGYPQT